MNKRAIQIVAQYVILMPRPKRMRPSLMTRLIASPAVKAIGDLVLLVIMLGFVFLIAFLLAGCFSDTNQHGWDDSSSSQWTESEETGFNPGSHETPGTTNGELTETGTSSGSSSTSTSDLSTASSVSSTYSSVSTSEPTSVTSEPTSDEMTTTEPVSPWYQPCYSNLDCEAPLRCYTSVIGKGHCAGYCEDDSHCEAPTSGNLAASCWILNIDPHDAICWLFKAVVSCTFIECPDGLVCYQLDDYGTKAVCAAP